MSTTPSEVPADGYARIALRLPHGCDGAATNEVAVRHVVWTAQDGFELPDGQFREVGLTMKMPAGEAGETIAFPTVQGCVDGAETAWIETAAEGEEEPEHPAPTVTLASADAGHGHGHDEDAATEDTTATAGESALEAAGDDGTDPLVIVALVVGVLGLAVGAAGLAAARRAR